MIAKFPHFSVLATRLLEIIGAAFASTCVVVLLGHLCEPLPPSAFSRASLASADQQSIRYVRANQVTSFEQFRMGRRRMSPLPASRSPLQLEI
jgi:hypothetical protein